MGGEGTGMERGGEGGDGKGEGRRRDPHPFTHSLTAALDQLRGV